MEKNIFKDFTNRYSLSKTLRFELIPQGKTQYYIEKNGIITEDEERDADYKKVKSIIDEYHKKFIEKTLLNLEFSNLEDYYALYSNQSKSEKEMKDFDNLEADLRKQVVKCFKENEEFDKLFKKEFITEELVHFVKDDEEKRAILKFQNFTTYFQGFFENRKNIYSDEAKSTAVSYRIVNQNLPKFIDNMGIFEKIMNTELSDRIAELQLELQKEYNDVLHGRSVETLFALRNYTNTITDSDIVFYNSLIGGFTLKNGTVIKGINGYVNEYNQKNSKGKTDAKLTKLPKLKPLYKQILADRESLSFVIEHFESDSQLLDTVSDVMRNVNNVVMESCEKTTIGNLLKDLNSYDLNKIYVVNGPTITALSNAVYKDWSVIQTCLEKEYDELNEKKAKSKTEKYYEARRSWIKNQKSFSLGKLNQLVEKYSSFTPKIETYYTSLGSKDGQNLIDEYIEMYENAEELLNSEYFSKYGLASDKKNVAILKQLLDSAKNLENFIKPLLGAETEAEKDDTFYGELDSIYKVLSDVIPLYNKVRNYVTKKPYSVEKVKLNFQNPTLLNGWDLNKEKDNLAVMFRKNGLYYLGIMNKKNNKVFSNVACEDTQDYYEKMEYKLLPGPNKMLPKVFFGKKNIEQFSPSEIILENYNKGSHKVGDNFNLEECHQLIDFFKASINRHEDWSKFGFKFTDTKEYKDISQFYHEVEKQGYSIKFKNIPADYIDELVDEGKLYLFQIYNKDFSPHSKGTPNLHTIYWKMLFDEKNLENVVYKLNGEAEVFYRKKSIDDENMIVHEKDKPIGRKGAKAKDEGMTSLFPYDIVKDKRFTVDKYQFHVPITMNFCAEGRSYINDTVFDTIRNNPEVNVIGVDRGERNLLYISVVSPEGKLLHQQSLNIVGDNNGDGQDYHAILDDREKKMDQARKNWLEIQSIKELKEGYLSQAIHEITDLMIKYQAIVVLEDLNFGFINGRKKVEKQVYQKFEKMLIDKLNYLVNKKADVDDVGGALHAYQLTGQFESFTKLGKQSGFLFYIPAWNTSKIDPTTGFVNLFTSKYTKYTNINEAKNFIRKFDIIRYNEQEHYFEFKFDYKNFMDKETGSRSAWTICSYGERIVNYRNPEKDNRWDFKNVDITEIIMEHLQSNNINLASTNLIEQICDIEDTQFFKDFIGDIKLVLQMRNSVPDLATCNDIPISKRDYMLSPVKNMNGDFFDTSKYDKNSEEFSWFPQDADANGAYNIARKGLIIMQKIRESSGSKVGLAITNKEWLDYAQQNTLL